MTLIYKPLFRPRDLLPPLLLDALRVARQQIRYPLHRALLQSNRVWQDRFVGDRVFVIANGPSVATFDRTLLRGHHVIVMNNFHRASWKDEVQPVAHCIGEPYDSIAWTDPSEAINGTESASYWLNIAAFGHVHGAMPQKLMHYVMAGYEPRLWGRRQIRLDKLAIGFQTTAQLAIQVALHMGFQDIRLLGFDHDWLASPEFSKHFYSDQPDSHDVLNTHSYYELIQFSLRMWEGYYALANAAKAHKACIVNMTDGSYLDVFPRCDPRPKHS